MRVKKIQFGTIELLGCIGIVIWVGANILRMFDLSNHPAYLFVVGMLPNVGASWSFTMLFKWLVQWRCGGDYTILAHMLLCGIVLLLGLISELIHDLFLGAPFDRYDMFATLLAQLSVMVLPIVKPDQCFRG